MTTYAEAFQMGLGSNLAVCVLNELGCAGDALTKAMSELEKPEELPPTLVAALTHVMNHLITLREVAEKLDDHWDQAINEFDEENPGKLSEVSKELGDSQLIKELQDIIGMTAEERAKIALQNMFAAALADAGEGKE